VKALVLSPKYNWGVNVDHNSIGVITSISADGKDVTVDFPHYCKAILGYVMLGEVRLG
jgi:hypothetical protein